RAGTACGADPADSPAPLTEGYPRLVFVFSGQGSQWPGMGQQLLEQEPVFRTMIERCDGLLRPYTGWSLLEKLGAAGHQPWLSDVSLLWPALFAIQAGLAALWRARGVVPAAVVGHSIGEVAAAYVAGALSLEDALRVIYHQGRLAQSSSGRGAMALVELPADRAWQALAGYEDRLGIAVSSSPVSSVLAGETAALNEVVDMLRREQVLCRQVQADIAAHSPLMEPLRAKLAAAL